MDECGHYKGCTYSAPEEADDAEVAEACEGEAEDIHQEIGFLGIFAIEEPGRYLVLHFLVDWGNEGLWCFSFVGR